LGPLLSNILDCFKGNLAGQNDFQYAGLSFPIAQFFITSCRAFPTSWDNLPPSPDIWFLSFFVFAASNRISKGNLIEQNKPFSYARIEANTSHYKGGVLSFGLVLRFFGALVLWLFGEFPNGPRGCLFSPFLSFFCTDFLVHFTRRSKCAKSLRFLKEGNRDDGEWLPLSKDYHFLFGGYCKGAKSRESYSANELCP